MPGHFLSLSMIILSLVFGGPLAKPTKPPAVTQISVYGAWHCGKDFCTWASVRNMTDFDTRNRWLIDRGSGQPSVNLVVLSFVHPMRLLNKTTDATTSQGIPIGMNQAVVDYFKSRGVRVALSKQSRGTVNYRPRCGGSLADCDNSEGHGRLA